MDNVFFKISPVFKGIGELCVVEFDEKIKKYIAVAWVDKNIFNTFDSFISIHNNLRLVGARDITINLTMECDINEITASVAKDSGKEVNIYFNL